MKDNWDYLDDFESGNYVEELSWLVKINDNLLDSFNTKEEAIWVLLDELNIGSNEMLYDGIGLIGFNDEEELFNSLYNMCAIDFYEQLEIIYDSFDIIDKYKLINIDNEEPEFGEL